jgi:RHS repeat-associated protein
VSSAGVTVYVNQYYTVRNGTKVTKHIFAGSQRVASVVDSGPAEQRLFLHTNHLGSTEFVTTATGAVTEHYEQLPFGEGWVEEVGSGGSSVPYRFTGKEIDEETGLYYFGARHYDPATGLWLSADPAMRDYATGNSRSGGLGSPANLNAYGYGWNSPLRMTDPDGREVFDLVDANGQRVGSAQLNAGRDEDSSRPYTGGVYWSGNVNSQTGPVQVVQTYHAQYQVVDSDGRIWTRSMLDNIGGQGERRSDGEGVIRHHLDTKNGVHPYYNGLDRASREFRDEDMPNNFNPRRDDDGHSGARLFVETDQAACSAPGNGGVQLSAGDHLVSAVMSYTTRFVDTNSHRILGIANWRRTEHVRLNAERQVVGVMVIVEVMPEHLSSSREEARRQLNQAITEWPEGTSGLQRHVDRLVMPKDTR